MYTLLEHEVIPCFYNRDERGIPRQWVARIRESMARLTTSFSASRTVRQYTEHHYISLASQHCARAAAGGREAADLLVWERAMASHWQDVRFGRVTVENRDGDYSFRVQVHLGGIRPSDVQVELYADPLNGDHPVRQPMVLDSVAPASAGLHEYTAVVARDRPADHYTPRVIPRCDRALIPLELPLITWQK